MRQYIILLLLTLTVLAVPATSAKPHPMALSKTIYVTVKTTPPGAYVYINNAWIGTTPISNNKITLASAGNEIVVEIRYFMGDKAYIWRRTYETDVQSIFINLYMYYVHYNNTVLFIEKKLTRSNISDFSILDLTALMRSGFNRYTINGRTTTIPLIMLKPGTYSIEISSPIYGRYIYSKVTITKNTYVETIKKDAILQLDFDNNVAEIYYGNKAWGTTPTYINLGLYIIPGANFTYIIPIKLYTLYGESSVYSINVQLSDKNINKRVMLYQLLLLNGTRILIEETPQSYVKRRGLGLIVITAPLERFKIYRLIINNYDYGLVYDTTYIVVMPEKDYLIKLQPCSDLDILYPVENSYNIATEAGGEARIVYAPIIYYTLIGLAAATAIIYAIIHREFFSEKNAPGELQDEKSYGFVLTILVIMLVFLICVNIRGLMIIGQTTALGLANPANLLFLGPMMYAMVTIIAFSAVSRVGSDEAEFIIESFGSTIILPFLVNHMLTPLYIFILLLLINAAFNELLIGIPIVLLAINIVLTLISVRTALTVSSIIHVFIIIYLGALLFIWGYITGGLYIIYGIVYMLLTTPYAAKLIARESI